MFKQILFAAVSEAIKAQLIILLVKYESKYGKDKADQLENKIRDAFVQLKQLAEETKTNIDDTLAELVLQAVNRHQFNSKY